eukprot:TRINITY_DN24744_c0_g1_i1.p1 TRINITY_DN24744_c0_g1~~TRINITY_DN24744_c0_g1_i1.p1  ORF type:complete len:397 (-),score=49.77 TRINITY_DN24744_c0_g1_i1:203-1393(-)
MAKKLKGVVNIAIVGTGHRVLDELLPHLYKHEQKHQIDIVAFCDPEPDSIAYANSKFNSDGCIPNYTDYRKLYADKDKLGLHWVMIGSKNNVHAEQIIAAFECGLDVFSEKPIAISVEECRHIKAAAEKYHRYLMIGYVLRHAPFYIKIKELLLHVGKITTIEANEYLTINHGEYIFSNWRRHEGVAGPMILEKDSHDIDIWWWLTGDQITTVASLGGNDAFIGKNNPLNKSAGSPGALDKASYEKHYCNFRGRYEDVNAFDSEKTIVDNQVVIAQGEMGTRYTFNFNAHSFIKQRRFFANGLLGSIEADLITGNIKLRTLGGEHDCDLVVDVKTDHGDGDRHIIGELVLLMLESVGPKRNAEVNNDTLSSINSAIVALTIDKAMKSGALETVAYL